MTEPSGADVILCSLDGDVDALHRFEPFVGRTVESPEVWVMRPTNAAIVLGSRQSSTLVDQAACAAAGLDVVRRRSGGGAVLVRRDDVVWIDVVVPRGIGPDDVRGSMHWIGACWAEAVRGLVGGPVAVHRGGMVATDWSEIACFAGLGPGEVLVGGRKFVGLSQRRGRAGIRVQGMFHLTASMDTLRSVLGTSLPPGVPEEPYWQPGVDPDGVAAGLVGALRRRL